MIKVMVHNTGSLLFYIFRIFFTRLLPQPPLPYANQIRQMFAVKHLFGSFTHTQRAHTQTHTLTHTDKVKKERKRKRERDRVELIQLSNEIMASLSRSWCRRSSLERTKPLNKEQQSKNAENVEIDNNKKSGLNSAPLA